MCARLAKFENPKRVDWCVRQKSPPLFHGNTRDGFETRHNKDPRKHNGQNNVLITGVMNINHIQINNV